jgi:hypothetical protein
LLLSIRQSWSTSLLVAYRTMMLRNSLVVFLTIPVGA